MYIYVFKDAFKIKFSKFQKKKLFFLLLFTYFLRSFLNVAFLSLVTKLSPFNYYRRKSQNAGVKDPYEKK